MEFYSSGINTLNNAIVFQFPTGWNSTRYTNCIIFPYCCFNSQRDGILLDRAAKHLPTHPVSIPNGMEFYPGRRFGTADPFVVSIPNGMEFYLMSLTFIALSKVFQFPTGWNSTITI